MTPTGQNSLATRSTLTVGPKTYSYYSLPKAAETLGDIARLPFSMKVLLENLLRFEDGETVTRKDLDSMAEWLKERSADPDWRGANLTIPHKERIIPMVDDPDGLAASVGAMNIVIPKGKGRAAGYNSDISGFAEPLDNINLKGKSAAVYGAGGAARRANRASGDGHQVDAGWCAQPTNAHQRKIEIRKRGVRCQTENEKFFT